MATLFNELKQLIISLEDGQIEYAVCGGLALAIHGFVRATLDIDILIQTDRLEKVLKLGEEKGFDIRGHDLSFKDGSIEIRRISKIGSDGQVLSLDLLLVTPVIQDIWDDRERIDSMGIQVSVVSRAGLIRMKTLAGRPQDLVDIERLENEES